MRVTWAGNTMRQPPDTVTLRPYSSIEAFNVTSSVRDSSYGRVVVFRSLKLITFPLGAFSPLNFIVQYLNVNFNTVLLQNAFSVFTRDSTNRNLFLR